MNAAIAGNTYPCIRYAAEADRWSATVAGNLTRHQGETLVATFIPDQDGPPLAGKGFITAVEWDDVNGWRTDLAGNKAGLADKQS